MTGRFGKYAVLILLLIAAVGTLLWYISMQNIEVYRQQQGEYAEFSVAQTEAMISMYLGDLQRRVNIFVEDNHALLTELAASPEDTELRSRVDAAVLRHFPDVFAYTLADSDGNVLLPDRLGVITEDCRSDLKAFARNPQLSNTLPHIHPDPYVYHFDRMSVIPHSQDAGRLFLISFNANRLAAYLEYMQLPGHSLYLVKTKSDGLIEVSAKGTRVRMDRSYRLEKNELSNLIASRPVNNTRWKLVDVIQYGMIQNRRLQVTERNLLLFVAFITGGLLALVIIKYQEDRRAAAEQRLAEHQRNLEKLVHDRTLALEQANQRLEHLSLSDGLTGIANRRHFDHVLSRELRRAIRENQPLSLLLLDIDHFKRFNDALGHVAGDEALKKIALAIERVCKRGSDLAARYGGEEFAVILPGADAQEALAQAERVRTEVEALAIDHPDTDVSGYVTVSVGISSLRVDQYRNAEDLIDAADAALYLAKSRGRNCSVVEQGAV